MKKTMMRMALCLLVAGSLGLRARAQQGLEWQLACSDTRDGDTGPRIEASVPGCVQFDWAKAHHLPSYHEGDHEQLYEGLEDKWWHYYTSTTIRKGKDTPYLCFEGVDYQYDVFVDGQCVLCHEGMFTRPRIDLSAYKGRRTDIEVLVHPAPKSGIEPYRGLGNESLASCKPAFTYGWDWCPRFVTLGLVDEVYISYLPKVHIDSWDLSYRLNDQRDTARIQIDYELTGSESLDASLLDPEGREVAHASAKARGKGSLHMRLGSPRLWWPWNHGEQPVYTMVLSSPQGERLSRKICFRRTEMVYNEGGRHDGAEVTVPACIQLNGRKLFAKGSNWVPSEMCRSEVKKEDVRLLLTYLKECNMNILRLWGGSYIQPDWFYDLCDEMGIMVWQEFPLACARYSEDEHYLDILAQESESIIKQLRTHGCLTMYCGGNELFFRWFDKWGGMSYQSPALRLLDSQTYLLDPGTPFWYASPQPGIRHGGYFPIQGDEELVTMFYDTRYFGYTEFGCGALTDLDYMRTIVSEEELRHPFESSVWKARHATLWGRLEVISQISGRNYSNDFEQGVKDANDIQGDCYRTVFELARQKWPYTSMALNWCFDEPWKTLAGNGLVNYPAHRRPAYYKVREALRPTLLSLSYRALSWEAGDTVRLGVYLLNDSPDTIPESGATIEVAAKGKVVASWQATLPQAAAWMNSVSPHSYTFAVPDDTDGRLSLRIFSSEHPEWNSEYTLYVKPSPSRKSELTLQPSLTPSASTPWNI